MIGVVLLIGAISLPFTFRQFERRTETEAIDRLGLLIRLARSESRSTGVPMEVRCDASGRRVTVFRVDPRDPPGFGLDGSGLGEDLVPERQLSDSWSVVVLPESLAIVPAPDEGDPSLSFMDEFDLVDGRSLEPSEETSFDEDPWPDATRLLLLVPDGNVITFEDVGLRSDAGWRRLRVDPWTAVTTLESPPSDPPAEPEDELDEDADEELDAFDEEGPLEETLEEPLEEPGSGGVE